MILSHIRKVTRMRRKALLVKEREIQVINWFAIRIQHDNEDYATMPEIARGLGMSPSSHLAKILNGLVEVGTLTKVEHNKSGRQLPNGSQSWGYKLKEGTFQRPLKQARTITVNSSRGAKQLEMF